MAQGQKIGSVPKLKRAARHKARNAAIRSRKVANARNNHLKNALKSNGAKFAAELRKHYAANPDPGRKAG